ncbi:MAG TPA: protein nirF [Gammaproteobacteria bacterium]|nr:protein nirF [Gammaproteobacteria bacterium]
MLLILPAQAGTPRGTGDLGIVIERADGAVLCIEHSQDRILGRAEGLGDLSHASAVFSRDERYAYVFGRDGGLSKIDLLGCRLEQRILQAGNSIGGAISQDGRLVAVSNYTPGGIRVFDARTLEPVADIPATGRDGKPSKVVGLVDAPGQRFVFSLYDAGEIWIADMKNPRHPRITRFPDIGRQPYDALLTPDGRYYIAGLFGEDSMTLLDLWHPERGVRHILGGYLAHDPKRPVYKMPHLEGWAVAGREAFVPAVGAREVLVMDTERWRQRARIAVHGQPVFVMAEPGGRRVWVNFAHPDNGVVQVIDTEQRRVVATLEPGPAVLHMEFTPRGEKVWVSVRDADRIEVYDTASFERVASLKARKPSGIFFTDRAHRTGL